MSDLYIGRVSEPGSWQLGDDFHLEASRLRRHGVCFGMTGSGKTGLCITLLEEIAAAGIPILAIDPKGDLANLALLFEDLSPARFQPWLDDDPTRASQTAQTWREGLSTWNIDEDDLRSWRERVAVRVHTPGSTAGIPIDLLATLSTPRQTEDDEALLDMVSGTVSSLLGLIGIEAEPLRDPRHIVLCQLLEAGWRGQLDGGPQMDLERLVIQLVDPPFEKVGVFPLETFLPRSDRLDLAMQLNGVLVAPGFSSWSTGEPLDIDHLLAPIEGRTPIRVMTLSHLGDAERSFFVAMLLHRLVAWSRRQPGTERLRALLFFDEVMGFAPPHPRNPPAKAPMLRIMKTARAVGLGAVLCTQNPVDVDYKALSNAGTWLIGRLSTRQDRDKVLDGLAGVASIDRAALARTLDGLPARTFAVRDLARPEPVLVHTRWAMTWLRGPLTRAEIQRLDQPRAEAPVPIEAVSEEDDSGWLEAVPPTPSGFSRRFLDPRVAFEARLAPFFGRHARAPRADGRTMWAPALYATLRLRFEGKEFLLDREEHRCYFPLGSDRSTSGEPDLRPTDLLDEDAQGLFLPLPPDADEARELKRLAKEVQDEVYRGEVERVFKHRKLAVHSRAGETRDAFTARVTAAADDKADAEIAKLEASVERKVDSLEDRLRRKQHDLDQRRSDARGKTAAEIVNAGEILYSLFFSSRQRSLSTVMSKRNQTRSAQERIERTETEIAELEREIYDLQIETETKILSIRNKWAAVAEQIEQDDVRLRRRDITLTDFVVLWVPVTRPL